MPRPRSWTPVWVIISDNSEGVAKRLVTNLEATAFEYVLYYGKSTLVAYLIDIDCHFRCGLATRQRTVYNPKAKISVYHVCSKRDNDEEARVGDL